MRQYILAAALGLAAAVPAQAGPLSLTATIGGVATGASLQYLTFDGPTVSPFVTFALGHNAQLVSGSRAGQYAAPYFSAGNGAAFGEAPANGADATRYVSIEAGGSARFNFSAAQTSFGVLWGSVDIYNHLSFYDSAEHLIGSIGGADVEAGANGNQGASGTFYVNVNSLTPFTSVVATSGSNAFEFDDVAFDPPDGGADSAQIAEPGTLLIFGVGLTALAGLCRRGRG